MSEQDERTQALYAYAAGIPSTIPSTNRYKRAVEAHRWGEHVARPDFMGCPVCDLRRNAQEFKED